MGVRKIIGYEVICDLCGLRFGEGLFRSHSEAKEEVKAEGWKFKGSQEVWCPWCVDETETRGNDAAFWG